MHHRLVHRARASAALVIACTLAACGGGGSSNPVPVNSPITTVPPAGTLVVPGQQSSGGGAGGFVNDGKSPSTYTVTSNPSGLAFTVSGEASPTYATPATITPTAATSGAISIVFSVSGYTVPISQVNDGPHSVFYNAASDATGTVALTSLQSIRRRIAGTAAHVAMGRPSFRPLRKTTSPASEIDPTHLAVRLSSTALRTSGRSASDVERAVGAQGRDTLSSTPDRLRVVAVPAGVDVATFTRKLQAQPEVAEVSAIHRRRLAARTPTTVSDPYYNGTDQWYDFATGANYAWSYNPGTGAKLAIVDTGIDEANTDLTSQLAFQETAVTPIDNTPNTANGGTPTCQPLANTATVVTPNTARDDNGHGTNVAGIAIAKQNTAGFVGAGWGAQLLAFKVFPDQNQYCNDASPTFGTSTADEAQAIQDAVTQGADVISLSLGSDAVDTVEFNAIESAIAAGVTVVAASGNSDGAAYVPGTVIYPAGYPGVISVGASALKDEYYTTQQPPLLGTYASSTEIVATYSQSGPSLSVVAPGGDSTGCAGSTCDRDTLHWIENYSTSTAYQPTEQCLTPAPATSCRALFNGTSMATPQVAATAAMLIAEAGGHLRLTPAQVNYLIESTADNINDPKQGHGRLNAYRALASLVRDTGAYTGPARQVVGTAQLVAFAYKTGNTNRPAIIDASFPAGVPVNATGAFRIADVPAATGTYRVAVWYDANGDGAIDAGDQIGTAPITCSSTAKCALGTITLTIAQAGYYLP